MNKQGLTEILSERIDMSKVATKNVVDTFFEVLTETLKGGEEVGISGFGTFKIVNTKARTGRNPKTGAPVQIAAKKVVKFKTGKDLK